MSKLIFYSHTIKLKFRMQHYDWSSSSPKEPMLHLSLSPCTGYRLQFASSSIQLLAYRIAIGSAPAYFHSLLRNYIPSRSLRSNSEWRLVVPSQRGSKSLSRTFSFTIPGWWNDLPTPIRNAGSLSTFKQQLKTHLFHYLTTWISLLEENWCLSLYVFIPLLALILTMRLGFTSISSVCCFFKMSRLMCSPIISRFG